MRRLQIDQPVSLCLDGVAEAIPCRVLDVQGAAGRLTYSDGLPPRAVGRLALGAAGYLVFHQQQAAVGLRVAVRVSPPHLDVAVIDGIGLPERRGRERVKLVTRVRIVAPDGSSGVPDDLTETINLSESGALVRDHPLLAGRRNFTLELMFGADPRPVRVQARVARRLAHAVGVVFDASDEDAIRLGEYLSGIRAQRRAALRN